MPKFGAWVIHEISFQQFQWQLCPKSSCGLLARVILTPSIKLSFLFGLSAGAQRVLAASASPALPPHEAGDDLNTTALENATLVVKAAPAMTNLNQAMTNLDQEIVVVRRQLKRDGLGERHHGR